ncbi:MAG: hypothetical protein EOM20_19015 [Spartobacteria bacterium]|nr:hypothetical protein [Spartobacteria bacterium]
MAKTLSTRTRAGWTTKPAPVYSQDENRLSNAELDDNLLEIHEQLESHVAHAWGANIIAAARGETVLDFEDGQYHDVTAAPEVVDSFTLSLGGANGGTFDIGKEGALETVNFDDNAATIEAAIATALTLDPEHVTVAAEEADFSIAFTGTAEDTGLIADFDALHGETFTLDLGGADGGTYELGKTGEMEELAYNANDGTVQAALETVFGAGNVTVSSGTITFLYGAGDTALIADFASLANATDPALTQTVAIGDITPALTQDTEYAASEVTLAYDNLPDVCDIYLYARNFGDADVTYPAGTLFAGGSEPSLTASGLDVCQIKTIDGGTTTLFRVLAADAKEAS